MKNILKQLLLTAPILTLAACGSSGGSPTPQEQPPEPHPDEIARQLMVNGNLARFYTADDGALSYMTDKGTPEFGDLTYNLDGKVVTFDADTATATLSPAHTELNKKNVPIFYDYVRFLEVDPKKYETVYSDARSKASEAAKKHLPEDVKDFIEAWEKLKPSVKDDKSNTIRKVYNEAIAPHKREIILGNDFKDDKTSKAVKERKFLFNLPELNGTLQEQETVLVEPRDINLVWDKVVKNIDVINVDHWGFGKENKSRTIHFATETPQPVHKLRLTNMFNQEGDHVILHKPIKVGTFSVDKNMELTLKANNSLQFLQQNEIDPKDGYFNLEHAASKISSGQKVEINKDYEAAYDRDLKKTFSHNLKEGELKKFISPSLWKAYRLQGKFNVEGENAFVFGSEMHGSFNGAEINGNITNQGKLMIDPCTKEAEELDGKYPEKYRSYNRIHRYLDDQGKASFTFVSYAPAKLEAGNNVRTTDLKGDFKNEGDMLFVLRANGDKLAEGYFHVDGKFTAGGNIYFALDNKYSDADGKTHKLIVAKELAGTFNNENQKENTLGDYTATLAKADKEYTVALAKKAEGTSETTIASVTPEGTTPQNGTPKQAAQNGFSFVSSPLLKAMDFGGRISSDINKGLQKSLKGLGSNLIAENYMNATNNALDFGFNASSLSVSGAAKSKDGKFRAQSMVVANSNALASYAFGSYAGTNSTHNADANTAANLSTEMDTFSAGAGFAKNLGGLTPFAGVSATVMNLDGTNSLTVTSQEFDAKISDSIYSVGLNAGLNAEKTLGKVAFSASLQGYKNLSASDSVKAVVLNQLTATPIKVNDFISAGANMKMNLGAGTFKTGLSLQKETTKPVSLNVKAGLNFSF